MTIEKYLKLKTITNYQKMDIKLLIFIQSHFRFYNTQNISMTSSGSFHFYPLKFVAPLFIN